jgi:hypothetical protein
MADISARTQLVEPVNHSMSKMIMVALYLVFNEGDSKPRWRRFLHTLLWVLIQRSRGSLSSG